LWSLLFFLVAVEIVLEILESLVREFVLVQYEILTRAIAILAGSVIATWHVVITELVILFIPLVSRVGAEPVWVTTWATTEVADSPFLLDRATPYLLVSNRLTNNLSVCSFHKITLSRYMYYKSTDRV